MLQNTLVVTISEHVTVSTWIFNFSLQHLQLFDVQVLAIEPKGAKLVECQWKYKDSSILNAGCQASMNILAFGGCFGAQILAPISWSPRNRAFQRRKPGRWEPHY